MALQATASSFLHAKSSLDKQLSRIARCYIKEVLGLPQKHWALAVAKAGEFDWSVPVFLLGLKPRGF